MSSRTRYIPCKSCRKYTFNKDKDYCENYRCKNNKQCSLIVPKKDVPQSKRELIAPMTQTPQDQDPSFTPIDSSGEHGQLERQQSEGFPFNWDVIGLTSVTVTLIGAAIFYIAGWIYEARWYSYYGVELSQLTLPPHQIMIQGVPGILILILSMSLSLVWLSLRLVFIEIWNLIRTFFSSEYDTFYDNFIDNRINHNESRRFDTFNITSLILQSYIISTIILIVFYSFIADKIPGFIAYEILITMPALLVLSILQNIYISKYSNTLYMFIIRKLIINVLYILIIRKLIIRPLLRRPLLRMYKEKFNVTERQRIILTDVLRETGSNEEIPSDRISAFMYIMTHVLHHVLHHGFIRPLGAVIRTTSRFWLGLILLLFFLVSISVSALLGDFDARRGARLLSGDWRLQKLYLFSDEKVGALQAARKGKTETKHVYGPLSLIISTDSFLFAIDWKDTNYFTKRPALYILPRKDSQQVSFGPYKQPAKPKLDPSE